MSVRRTAIAGSTVMTATEAIEWIAHRRRLTWSEVSAEQREYEDWCLTLDGSAIRKAAQALARGLPERHLWEPAPAEGQRMQADMGPSYQDQMSAPGTRTMLETICARLEQRFGRPMSFAELAERVEPETARLLARFQARREALAALIDAARGGQLIADGKPDGEDGLPDDSALAQPIPSERWQQKNIGLTEDRLTWLGSAKRGIAGRSFSDVCFKTADIGALWPADLAGEAIAGPPGSEAAARPAIQHSSSPEHAPHNNLPPFAYGSAYERFLDLKQQGQPRMTRPEMEALIEREFKGKPTDREMRQLMKLWPNRKRGRLRRNAPKPPAQNSGTPRKS